MKIFSKALLFAALTLGQVVTVAPSRGETIGVRPPPLSAPALISLLREGGYILLVRHERTEVPSLGDDFSKPRADCLSQRNLSSSGYAGARETGGTLRILGIKVAEVRSSPLCRTMETARLMFGKAVADERLMHDDPPRGRSIEVADRDLKELLSEIDPARGNVALVTHGGNITKAFNVTIVEGAIAVVTRAANGQITFVGQTTGSDLDFPARAANK